jgi:gliding motility-associated-like protein
MTLYDRWGQLVYNNTDPNGWNGFFAGDPQPAGVYTYFITIDYPDPLNPGHTLVRNIEGSFTLLR